LRDGVANPDSPHTGEDLTDLYRLYLDYKIKSLQEANGVDLLLVIDHSGSMNNHFKNARCYFALLADFQHDLFRSFPKICLKICL